MVSLIDFDSYCQKRVFVHLDDNSEVVAFFADHLTFELRNFSSTEEIEDFLFDLYDQASIE